MKLGRRKFIALAASFTTITLLGGKGVHYFSQQKQLIEDILYENLPGVYLDDQVKNEFVDFFIAENGMDRFTTLKFSRRKIMEAIDPDSKFFSTSPWLGYYKRSVITAFLNTTDFLDIENPESQSASFTGKILACNNIFAQID